MGAFDSFNAMIPEFLQLEVFQMLYERGGIMMIPLWVLSLMTLTIAIERAFMIRRGRLFPKKQIQQLQQIALQNPEKLQHFLTLSHLPIARVLKHASHHSNQTDFRESVEVHARHEIYLLERGLSFLETTIGLAPLMGLLGTSLGMIDVFANLSLQTLDRTSALSSGISQALITTVFGLAIAIPASLAYGYFSRKVEALALQLERETLQFYQLLFPNPS